MYVKPFSSLGWNGATILIIANLDPKHFKATPAVFRTSIISHNNDSSIFVSFFLKRNHHFNKAIDFQKLSDMK